MPTFDRIDETLGLVPTEWTTMLRRIDRAQGEARAFSVQHPERLKALQGVARVQSIEASNAIEGIKAPHARIEALAADRTTPQNRPEQEIAAYRKVLDLIHSSNADAVPFTVNVVLQFHQMLYEWSPRRGGDFKTTDNQVVEALPDGSRALRFTPVPAWQTRAAMERLHEQYRAASQSERFHPLLLEACYILDFLVIHPFCDGNGRMSRVLTLLLLYKGGYDVGRFISLEKLIEGSKETYYEALQASTTGWHDGRQDVGPWVNYFLGTLVGAYAEFESRTGALGPRGSKTEAVKTFVRASPSDEFAINDVREATGRTVSDVMIRKVLKELKSDGAIEVVGRGPAARYRRLKADRGVV